MYAQALRHFPYIPLVVAGMLLFFAAFAAVLFVTFKLNTHHDAANMPLTDEESGHGR